MISFLKIWIKGITRPKRAFAELTEKPAPHWGLYAVLIRFVVTSLTSILALYMLAQTPFEPSYLTFLSAGDYYRAEIFFLPAFGVTAWLLGGAVTHLILRLTGKDSNFDWILNVIGFGLLIPMPVLWILDWSTIALNIYGGMLTPVIHALISIWEITLFGIGLSKMRTLDLRWALLLGLLIKGGIYIPLAMIFVR